MRSAPPVLVPVGRFLWGPRISVVLALVVALLCALAVSGQGGAVQVHALTALVWLVSTAIAVWAWSRERLPQGELSWDGEAWWYQVPAEPQQAVAVELVWDAGQAMLLCLRLTTNRPQGLHHVWLQARQMRLAWHGLRCAVHGRDTL